MKSLFIALFALSTSFLHANDGKAPKWDVDATHSAINFSIRHFFTPVSGAFEAYDMQLYFDPANLKGSSVDVNVKIASVNTKNEKRDDHLRNPDFFEEPKYPTMRFVSNDFRKISDNQFVAKGKLTIRDVTKDVEVPFTLLGVSDHPWKKGSLVAGLKAGLSLKRLEFGVGSGNFLQTSVVGDDVEISINLEVTRTK